MDLFAGAEIVEVAALPERLEGGGRVGEFVQAMPGALLLRVPGVGAYLVEHGRSIRFARDAQSEPDLVAAILHGAARMALLHQRGDLPLRASMVQPPGASQAIALCGISGTGKSTLAVEMHRRGWTILADDIVRISLADEGPVAWPGGPGVKLWRDACATFGLDATALEPVRGGLQKFYHPVVATGDPVALGAVVELSGGVPALHTMESPAERMSLITRHTCGMRHIAPLGMLPHHVKLVRKTASQVSCVRLGGARLRSVAELGDRIEEASQWMHP